MRKPIGTYEAAEETYRGLENNGLFLVSGQEGNPMTIGWATLGRVWSLPVLTVLVRPSRHSFSLLEELGEFTVNLPASGHKKALSVCGSKSGREVNKIELCGFSLVKSEHVGVPFIRECPVHYECRVVHKSNVINADLDNSIVAKSYPRGDFHRVYYGEVLGVYREE